MGDHYSLEYIVNDWQNSCGDEVNVL